MTYGMLCKQYGGVELPIETLCSAAGWYIGTFSEYEGPMSRESVEYYPTEAAAQAALDAGTWTQRERP